MCILPFSAYLNEVSKHIRPCLKKEEAVLNQNNSNSGQVNEGKKRRIQLVVPGGNMTNLFKLLEEALNHMALFIQPAVYQPQLRNIVLWRNHIAGTMI